MRAVLDANVLIAALLSPSGSPARVLRAWEEGTFELVASPASLAELGRALAYPKLRRLVSKADAGEFVDWMSAGVELVDDPDSEPPVRSSDPRDDYLIVLAAKHRAVLVSGDKHLLDLADQIPVLTPAAFLELLSGG